MSRPDRRFGLRTVFAVVLIVAAPAAAAGEAWRSLPDAPQALYRDGVPHTDAQGRPLAAYDPQRSFFPIGLYHGLTGTHGGIAYDFGPIAAAGFNTVVAWGGLETADILAEAERSGVQVIVSEPRDDEVRAARGHPHVLAFDIDHEPSLQEPGPEVDARLARFEEWRAEIRAIDPGRAVFAVDSHTITRGRRAHWLDWKRAGDIASFFAYPVLRVPPQTLASVNGIGALNVLSASAVDERKPVWFVAQAFESMHIGWHMPEGPIVRAMAYAALVHGATGIVWFGYDSFVTRNGAVIGIAPDPQPEYSVVLPDAFAGSVPTRASASQLRRSMALWGEVAALNAELAQLGSVWLAPGATREYSVEVRGESASETPLRTNLKAVDGGLVLVGVNMDARALAFRATFDEPVSAITGLAGDAEAEALDGRIVGALPPFGTFALRLTLAAR